MVAAPGSFTAEPLTTLLQPVSTNRPAMATDAHHIGRAHFMPNTDAFLSGSVRPSCLAHGVMMCDGSGRSSGGAWL